MSGSLQVTTVSSDVSPAGVSPRSRWNIDDLLAGLLNQSIRVAAEAFAPVGPNGPCQRLIRTNDLILPDGTKTDGMPVFVEGVLVEVSRRIGIIHVRLGAPAQQAPSTEGCVHFRGKPAVILRGPAIVRLAYPFQIERLPAQEENYWRDIHLPQVQFVLSGLNRNRQR